MVWSDIHVTWICHARLAGTRLGKMPWTPFSFSTLQGQVQLGEATSARQLPTVWQVFDCVQEDAIVRAAVHPGEASSMLRVRSLSRRLEFCSGNGFCWLCKLCLSLPDWSFCRVAIKPRYGILKHGSWWRRSRLPSTCGFRPYWRRSAVVSLSCSLLDLGRTISLDRHNLLVS